VTDLGPLGGREGVSEDLDELVLVVSSLKSSRPASGMKVSVLSLESRETILPILEPSGSPYCGFLVLPIPYTIPSSQSFRFIVQASRDGLDIDRHLLQLVGLELFVHSGREDVRVPVVEL
jgi:hypothetical protein